MKRSSHHYKRTDKSTKNTLQMKQCNKTWYSNYTPHSTTKHCSIRQLHQ